MKQEELITYCGIYAKNCCSWWENAIDSKLAEALAELVDASYRFFTMFFKYENKITDPTFLN